MHQIMTLRINKSKVSGGKKKTTHANFAEAKPCKPNSTTGDVFPGNTNLGAPVEADIETKERGEAGGPKEGQDCCWAPHLQLL